MKIHPLDDLTIPTGLARFIDGTPSAHEGAFAGERSITP